MSLTQCIGRRCRHRARLPCLGKGSVPRGAWRPFLAARQRAGLTADRGRREQADGRHQGATRHRRRRRVMGMVRLGLMPLDLHRRRRRGAPEAAAEPCAETRRYPRLPTRDHSGARTLSSCQQRSECRAVLRRRLQRRTRCRVIRAAVAWLFKRLGASARSKS